MPLIADRSERWGGEWFVSTQFAALGDYYVTRVRDNVDKRNFWGQLLQTAFRHLALAARKVIHSALLGDARCGKLLIEAFWWHVVTHGGRRGLINIHGCSLAASEACYYVSNSGCGQTLLVASERSVVNFCFYEYFSFWQQITNTLGPPSSKQRNWKWKKFSLSLIGMHFFQMGWVKTIHQDI